MLVKIGNDDKPRLVEVRVVGVEVCIRDVCPSHTSLSCPVDDTRVNLREGLLNVVVESSRHALPSSPELDVGKLIHGVVGEADMEAGEVVEFQILYSWVSEAAFVEESNIP